MGAFVRAAVDRALAEDRLAYARRTAEAFLDAELLPVGEPVALEAGARALLRARRALTRV